MRMITAVQNWQYSDWEQGHALFDTTQGNKAPAEAEAKGIAATYHRANGNACSAAAVVLRTTCTRCTTRVVGPRWRSDIRSRSTSQRTQAP
mmetsp:Transcript_39554/g.98613  ORF Transcript_39554/g.98613 Transcript_39554/m.98613 type:complete len:91 (-) Transcript_39554:1016-1288(-)